MKYIIKKDGKIVGYANDFSFCKYISAFQIQYPCKKEEAQYILCANDDTLYHADWMKPEPAGKAGIYGYAEVETIE